MTKEDLMGMRIGSEFRVTKNINCCFRNGDCIEIKEKKEEGEILFYNFSQDMRTRSAYNAYCGDRGKWKELEEEQRHITKEWLTASRISEWLEPLG